jgi:hypothetical protein
MVRCTDLLNYEGKMPEVIAGTGRTSYGPPDRDPLMNKSAKYVCKYMFRIHHW